MKRYGRRRGRRLAILLGLVPLVASVERAAAAPPDTWYAQTLTLTSRSENVTHLWSKGSALRTETVIEGHKVVTIVSGSTYYAIDALRGTGLAIQRTADAIRADKRRARPFGNERQAILDQGGEKIGVEEVAGRPCDIYRVTDRRGRRQIWVTQGDPALPVRVEVFNRGTGDTRRVSYVNWRRGFEVLDAFFEPSPHIQLERMTYEEYVARSAEGVVGSVPVMYPELLYTRR